MLTVLFLLNGMPWVWVALGGIFIFFVLGACLDNRFFILALIWIFMFVPLVVAFLYFFYGMKPLTAFNALPHILIVDRDKLSVRIIEHETEESEEEKPSTKKDFIMEFSKFDQIRPTADYVILYSKQDGWLWLPMDAFQDKNQFTELISRIRPYTMDSDYPEKNG